MRTLGTLGFVSTLAVSASVVVGSPASAAPSAGDVFTLTNSPSANAVQAYSRSSDGSLSPIGTFSTGGLGTGGGLGNQGALALTPSHDQLIAVNPGSDTVALLRVLPHGLKLKDVVSSGGDEPISVTIYDDLVYVLNASSGGSISGFTLGGNHLRAIAGSTRPLSGTSVGPAEVSFDPAGDVLLVTEKSTNLIDSYVVNGDGTATGPTPQASNGETPFGFAFGSSGRAYVSEAFGGAAGASAVSSYDVASDGALTTVSPSVHDTQSAACWVVVTDDERFAYATNTGSGNLSSFAIASDGSLTLSNAVAGVTGAGPIDMAFTSGDGFLYTLNSGAHSISGFVVNPDGSLSSLAGVSGLPAGATGLAAF
jgi:6-phosphogluconolactonase (cycloisomerase 2 family)